MLITFSHFIRTAQFEHTVLITDTGVEVLTVDTEEMELGTTVQSGYSRHREKEEKYICYEASFKGHCILHKKVRINFTTNACSVVLWLPMFVLLRTQFIWVIYQA